MTSLPGGAAAIMSSRVEPPDSLDFFPTPPWATRAFIGWAIHYEIMRPAQLVREPAAGEGHMAEIFKDARFNVLASDVFDYGVGYLKASYVGQGADVLKIVKPADWVVTNPPFNRITDFLDRAMEEAREGVALLVRPEWLMGITRFAQIFEWRAPSLMVNYAERVPMLKGRWDPNGDTATDYCWAVWDRSACEAFRAGERQFRTYQGGWIEPGQRQALSHPSDPVRFPDRRSPEEIARQEREKEIGKLARLAAKERAVAMRSGILPMPPATTEKLL